MDIEPTLEPDFWAHCPAPDLTKPSLQGLAWMLERESEWKDQFAWFFSWWYLKKGQAHPMNVLTPRAIIERMNQCGTAGCAIGLAHHTWGGKGDNVNHKEVVLPIKHEIGAILERRGIDHTPAAIEQIWRRLFGISNRHGDTSPEYVAGRIKDFLSNKPIR